MFSSYSCFISERRKKFDIRFQIRPFLIIDEGKGMLILENPDYLALKITKKNIKINNVKEITNWKQLGLKDKLYIRIEIPERIEQKQLIGKIDQMPKEQFVKYYKLMISILNKNILKEKTEEKSTTS